MAKAIKVFSGSTSSGTIYTVPASRVAKVTIGMLSTNGGTGYAYLIVGGQYVFVTGNSGVLVTSYFNSYTTLSGTGPVGLSPGSGQKLVREVAGGSTSYYIMNTEFYLIAGGTVVIGTSDSNSTTYNFSAVEEF
jgi:hypothetical protein